MDQQRKADERTQRKAVSELLGHNHFTIVNCARESGNHIVLEIAEHATKTGLKVIYNTWTGKATWYIF